MFEGGKQTLGNVCYTASQRIAMLLGRASLPVDVAAIGSSKNKIW